MADTLTELVFGKGIASWRMELEHQFPTLSIHLWHSDLTDYLQVGVCRKDVDFSDRFEKRVWLDVPRDGFPGEHLIAQLALIA